ncbi:MAG TPA: winged helix-turn-helix domain-containing protein [Candidatus Acidoferrales bacterium]|nr:winged helix-turn-helix domain-containing protein [Candidatus Acidoferrales bacterium]
MSKRSALHPKAYLTSRRNVKAGLIARTRILLALEKERKSAPSIVKEAGLSYACVTYHLKAMKKDRLVDKLTKSKPFTWGLTPFGQQKLPSQ